MDQNKDSRGFSLVSEWSDGVKRLGLIALNSKVSNKILIPLIEVGFADEIDTHKNKINQKLLIKHEISAN